jgi:hypothetical protein
MIKRHPARIRPLRTGPVRAGGGIRAHANADQSAAVRVCDTLQGTSSRVHRRGAVRDLLARYHTERLRHRYRRAPGADQAPVSPRAVIARRSGWCT